jgi:hypothetical protein
MIPEKHPYLHQAVNKRKTSIKNKLGINTNIKIDNWAADI